MIGVGGDSGLATLLRAMQCLLDMASSCLGEVAGTALKNERSSDSSNEPIRDQDGELVGRVGEYAAGSATMSDLSLPDSGTQALSRVYAVLQDASSVYFSTTLLSETTCTTTILSTVQPLLNANGLWAELQLPETEARASITGAVTDTVIDTCWPIRSAWRQRTATIRAKFLSLGEADARLMGATDRADSLLRENSAMGVELRATRCKLTESLATQASRSTESANDSALEDIKKENEVWYIYLFIYQPIFIIRMQLVFS